MQVVLSIQSLYNSDYRVRQFIRRLLEDREYASKNANIAFQLAFCCKIGFGGYRDELESTRMLHTSRRTNLELEEILGQIDLAQSDGRRRADTAYAAL